MQEEPHLDHLVGGLPLGQLLALARPDLEVLPLDDTLDREAPLVGQALGGGYTVSTFSTLTVDTVQIVQTINN